MTPEVLWTPRECGSGNLTEIAYVAQSLIDVIFDMRSASRFLQMAFLKIQYWKSSYGCSGSINTAQPAKNSMTRNCSFWNRSLGSAIWK